MRYLWLASFPRSGNTFFRNVLFHVYGIDSIEDESYSIENTKSKLIVIKTHNLPSLVNNYSKELDKVIYLVRDGRDAICSIAFKRKNLIAPSSDLFVNFQEATYAPRGIHFGGWASNCRLWMAENPIIIRFEDLVSDPRKTFEEIEKHVTLPVANWDELPDFKKQKKGETKFGSAGGQHAEIKNFSEVFFRQGKVGGWKTEMPLELQSYFWTKSKKIMLALGYQENGEVKKMEPLKIEAIKNEHFYNSFVFFANMFWCDKSPYVRFKKYIKSIILNQ